MEVDHWVDFLWSQISQEEVVPELQLIQLRALNEELVFLNELHYLWNEGDCK